MLWPKGQLCVGGGGGGGGEGVQRPSGMTGISAILFNLNNFTVSNISLVAFNNLKEEIFEILRIFG